MIKKIILATLLIASSLFGAEVNWAKDYHEGIIASKKDNKPVLFIISRDTCKYCVLLKDTTLRDESVIKALNKDFISVTSWTNENDYIPDDLARATPGLPGIWFLKPDGEPMFQPILGYMDKSKFLEALAIVQSEFKKESKGK
jgi:thioredoxin-related protein